MRTLLGSLFGCIRWVLLVGALSSVASAEGAREKSPPASDELPNSEEDLVAPSFVQITLIASSPDPDLLARASSWFPREVGLAARYQSSVEQSSVVDFSAPSAIGIWIFLTEGSKQIYFALRREGNQRYLRRSFEGELDEEGREALAQMLHYSAMALWEGSLSSERKEVEDSLTALPLVYRLSALDSGEKPVSEELPASVKPWTSGLESASPDGESADPAGELDAQLENENPKARASVPLDPVRSENAERAERNSEIRMSATAGYGVNFRPREALAHGPELSLGLPLGSFAWITLGGRWLLPSSFQVETSEVEMTGARLRLLAEFPFALGAGWNLDLAGGLGVDLVDWQVTKSELSDLRHEMDARPSLSSAAGIRKSIGSWQFGARALLDLALTKTQYTQEDNSEEEVLLSSSLWSPGVALFVGYSSDL